MPNLMKHNLTKQVLQVLESQKFDGRDAFRAMLAEYDDEIETKTAQTRRLRYRLGKLLDLLPNHNLDYNGVNGRDCCDE